MRPCVAFLWFCSMFYAPREGEPPPILLTLCNVCLMLLLRSIVYVYRTGTSFLFSPLFLLLFSACSGGEIGATPTLLTFRLLLM